jgi:putative RNA 2'-phosphotransferase
MGDALARTSTFLSYVLRHDPDALGLTLAPGGWADVDLLLERARAEGRSLTRARLRQILQILDAGEKDCFTMSADGAKIRANYGHSIDVDLGLRPASPSGRLYHGTARQALSAIRDGGLRPQSRQYVHLSSTPADATAVVARPREAEA